MGATNAEQPDDAERAVPDQERGPADVEAKRPAKGSQRRRRRRRGSSKAGSTGTGSTAAGKRLLESPLNEQGPATHRHAPSERALVDAWHRIRNWYQQSLEFDAEGGPLPSIPIDIALEFEFGTQRSNRTARAFVARAKHALADAIERLELDRFGYRQGHVHCFWCEHSLCEHSRPPQPLAIFVGYDATGTPRWRDFGSWAVERGDDRVDRLYFDHPEPFCRVFDVDALTADLLPEFGKGSGRFVIVSQLVAGNFALASAPRRGETNARSVAVTAQLIEGRRAGGAPSYSLNLVCAPARSREHADGVDRSSDTREFGSLVAERSNPVLSDWVDHQRTTVRELERALRAELASGRPAALVKTRQRAHATFAKCALQLEKLLRRADRRTRHAEDRTRDPARPTASALSDAMHAKAQQLYFDRKDRTVIVRGPKNRIHAFKLDGTHITSIVHTGKAIGDRIRQGRWIQLAAETIESFRTALSLHSSRHTEGDGGARGWR